MNKGNLICFISLINLFFQINYCYCIEQERKALEGAVSNLITQFSSAMNLRKKNQISNFINYYADENAKFERKSILVDDNNESISKEEREYALNKSEYIEYLCNIASRPLQYSFNAQITNFNFDHDNKFAIAGIAIEEVAISQISGPKRSNLTIKVVVSTNCNFSFDLQQIPPSILGNNCIEKIIIK